MKGHHRVVLLLIVLLLLLLGLVLGTQMSDKYYNSHKAILQSEEILLACDEYSKHPDAGKKLPANLTDLVKPPFGGGSYLRHGDADLLDPWGNPFKYTVMKNAQGETELYVWAERPVEGKLKLLGAKMLASGKIEKFGHPE